MIYKTWDVVAVPFPFTDVNVQKKRPAIVISAADFQEKHGHIILAMITSAKQSRWPGDVPLTALSDAGLKSASIMRPKIFTLDERLILKCVGRLSQSDQRRVTKSLRKAFGFL